MAYVKHGSPGKITMDLPSTNYIYELPLLSFGDIHGSMNLSLIFNRQMKADNSNPFSLIAGYKLNVQKVLEIENNVPVSIMDENGNCVALMGNSAPYTFDDYSQRILRVANESSEPRYVVENPDFSMEYYNSSGMIDSVVDKYGVEVLKFTYNTTNGKMVSVCYRGEKTIQFTYSNSQLSTIIYSGVGCSVSLAYSSTNISVTHYSGEVYQLICDARGEPESAEDFVEFTEFSATATSVGCSTELKKNEKTITISDYIGTEEVNRTSYLFPDYVWIASSGWHSYVDVTDYQGVTTRMEYSYGLLLYSYEVNGTDVDLSSGSYMGNVQIHRTADDVFNGSSEGVQPKKDGIPMQFSTSANEWYYEVNQDYDPEAMGYYLLTGWTKKLVDADTTITIVGHPNGYQYYTVDSEFDGKWKFFAYRFYANAAILRAILPDSDLLATKDFRITFQQTGVIDSEDSSHIRMSGAFLVSDFAEIPFGEAVFCYACVGENGTTEYPVISDMTVTDVLRYKRKKKKDGTISEVYYDNCAGIISNVPLLMVLYDGTRYGISHFNVAIKTYSKGNEYTQKICVDENNPSSDIYVFGYVNGNAYSTEKLNLQFDTVYTKAEGVKTTYGRNINGLITSESVSDESDNIFYERTTEYGTDASGNPTITATDEFGNATVYTLDPDWGVVTSVNLPDGSSIADYYDDDACAKTSRVFVDSTPRAISRSYSGGNLSGLQTNGAAYSFTYTNGDLTAISKNSTQIEAHAYTYPSESNAYHSVTNSCYPSSTNPLHSTLATYDKYGRLQSVSGVLTNVYDVDPTFSTTTGELVETEDNGSARLAMSTDVNWAETSRFTYHKNGLLANKTVTDEEAFEDKISEETFAYDDINRMTEHVATYDAMNGKSVSDVISYNKAADAPGADNAVKNYTYKVNNDQKAFITNTFDIFNRLATKTAQMNASAFAKTFSYNKTRVSAIAETLLGTNIGTNTYTYDTVGRIKATNYTSAKSSSSYRTYEYDKFGQLVRENNQGLAKTFIYSYNSSNGNLLSVKEYPYTLSTTPSGTAATTSFGYTADQLTSFGGATIGYNAMGCPTSYDGKTATWSKGRLSRLSGGTLASGTTNFNYSYNAFGQRIAKSYSYLEGTSGANPVYAGQLTSYSKKYHYDHSGRLLAETVTKSLYNQGTANESIVFLYDESGVVGMEYTAGGVANRYYFQRNLQGDVEAIYDTNGNLVVKYLYDAWGNCTISSETTNTAVANANPIRYRGYYFDEDTGLYYCNARYYSPKWRRFISPDDTAYLDPETVNGLNLYCYCNNDPVNYADPSGHSWESFWTGVGNWFGDNWKKLAIGTAFIVAGAAVAFFTAGMGLAGLAAAGAALVTSAKAVGMSMIISAGIGAAVGGITGGWEGALHGFGDGLADGFMWGGIFAGSSQILGGMSKFLRSRNVYFQNTTNWLFGNRNSPSTTLVRVNRNGKQLFRIDADIEHLWHLHYGKTGAIMKIHRTKLALLIYCGVTNGIKGLTGRF